MSDKSERVLKWVTSKEFTTNYDKIKWSGKRKMSDTLDEKESKELSIKEDILKDILE